MNNQHDRKYLEQFCYDFLNERNRHLNNVMDNYRQILAQINIQQLNLTKETFDSSFKSICKKMFNIDKKLIKSILYYIICIQIACVIKLLLLVSYRNTN